MKFCTRCGNELGVGRFCTNCGQPVVTPPQNPAPSPPANDATMVRPMPPVPAAPEDRDPLSTTAERAAVRATPPPAANPPSPVAPPPAVPPPAAPVAGARFPLYADEIDPGQGPTHMRSPSQPAEVAWAPAPGAEPAPSHRQRRGGAWLVFGVVGLVLALAVVLGIWLIGRDSDDPATATDPADEKQTSASPSEETTPDDEETPSEDVTAPESPEDIARFATARASTTAPPNEDLSGNLIRYNASNMLDGVPATSWRMDGDGTGEVLRFTLDEESVLTKVGLVNGYAKTDIDKGGQKIDWYARNRRITAVEWTFGDGTTVTQKLSQTKKMQTIDVGPLRTDTIELRLVSVSKPAKGKNGRNYTPISDVSLVGGPA